MSRLFGIPIEEVTTSFCKILEENNEMPNKRIDKAVELGFRYGGIDGDHHKCLEFY